MPDIRSRRFAVSVWYEAGDIRSTGIGFEDYNRCHTEHHKQASQRRLTTPDWAISNEKFQEVLVTFLEERARIRSSQRVGTQKQRLQRAQQAIVANARKLVSAVDNLSHEYVHLKRSATTPQEDGRLRKLEIQIENLDTRLRLEGKDGGASFVAGCVYHYYRLGSDSVGCGLALGAKPPHIRRTLWRLARTWERIERARRRCKKIDITGKRFGRLVVLKDSGKRTPSGGTLWLCRCDCGEIRIVWSHALRHGTTKSCGCYQRELGSSLAARALLKHGHTTGQAMSPTYTSWSAMKKRCLNSTHPDWSNYGGRGITVCNRWLGKHGFENFLADMGKRPEGRTLDRIDVNGNYERTNCRWATPAVQNANRRCCLNKVEEEFEIV